MKTTANINALLAVATVVLLLIGCGGNTQQLEAENAALRAEVEQLKAQVAATDAARQGDAKRAQSDVQDAVRLRGEVTQLRHAAKDAEKLRAENQQLKNENQQLRTAASAAAATPPPATPAPAIATGAIPKESWTFAGYATPEAALISAIWSMQQGNPKQYFESLTEEEQLRMAKTWEGKSADEIAAKHRNDTAAITGLRVLQREEAADGAVIKVFIEGVNREERVRMQRVGNEWKFGGFIREPGQ